MSLSFMFIKADCTGKYILELSGRDWKMEGTLPGKGVEHLFHKYMPDCNYAQVPGDVFTDLWRMGRIDDMNFGTNAIKAKWVNEYEWWYFKYFDIPEDMEDKRLWLQFDGVDFGCDVYLNGRLLGSHEGMFSDFSFDITENVIFVSEGETQETNYLAIRLHPAVRNISFANGRKYRWHGDYNQNVVPTGIWQPVRIIATGETRITDIYAKPVLLRKGADLNVEIEVYNVLDKPVNIKSEIKVYGKNFKSREYSVLLSKEVKPGLNKLEASVRIPDAKLWWPWDMGEQNLYNVDVYLSDFEGKVLDNGTITTGIREVKMEMNPGWSKDEVEYPWTVMINGKRHFVRSGTWGGPPDMFTGRTTENDYRELIRLAKDANINNLRIFNWHPLEKPIFYELCNEAGITVWQDMGMMNNIIHYDEKLKKAAFDEVICATKQRRNHPCNIIIEGSEEILFINSQKQRKFQWNFVVELGDTLKKYTDLHYIPTSPLSSHHSKFLGLKDHESAHPHGVHYSAGRFFMEDYYPKQNYAAIPELAVTSCPSVESIRKFIPEDELWPPKPSWGYHWADLDILQAHNYEVFGEDFTNKGIDAFVEATQIAQGTYFQYAMELYRTRKPKMSAVCFCHFILNSPDFKWATVDYYLKPKKSHYFIQKAYQPLLITLQYDRRRWMPDETFEGSLWVVNDFMRDFNGCKANIRIMDNDKNIVYTETVSVGKVPEDSSRKIYDLKFKVPGKMKDKFYIELELIDTNGTKISVNDYMLLVDNQKEALKVYQKYGEKMNERKSKYGKSATFRYFPGFYDNNKSLEVDWLNVD